MEIDNLPKTPSESNRIHFFLKWTQNILQDRMHQFSCSVVSDSLWPYGLQHTRLAYPSSIQRAWANMSIESVMPSNILILCLPFLLPSSIFPGIRVFSSASVLCIRWPKYWSFSFSISPSSGYSGLISFRMEWLDLLAVQGILNNLLQHHSSKTSVHWCSAFWVLSSMLTAIHDYWKKHSFDETDLCWQSNVSAFQYAI